jgi:hypothetical protein
LPIDEQFRKCVLFMFVDVPGEDRSLRRTPVGTAFLMTVPFEELPGGVTYAVTARHVVEASRPYGLMYSRFNLKGGGFEDCEVSPDSWEVHPLTDVAVHPLVFE